MEYWEKYVEFDESSICYKVMGDQTGWLWVVKHREMEKDEWILFYGPYGRNNLFYSTLLLYILM